MREEKYRTKNEWPKRKRRTRATLELSTTFLCRWLRLNLVLFDFAFVSMHNLCLFILDLSFISVTHACIPRDSLGQSAFEKLYATKTSNRDYDDDQFSPTL